LADAAGVELIGRIPIENAVADGGDHGRPVALGDGAAARELRRLADRITTDLAPPAGLAGCSARMLDAVTAALDAHDADPGAGTTGDADETPSEGGVVAPTSLR